MRGLHSLGGYFFPIPNHPPNSQQANSPPPRASPLNEFTAAPYFLPKFITVKALTSPAMPHVRAIATTVAALLSPALLSAAVPSPGSSNTAATVAVVSHVKILSDKVPDVSS